MKKPTVEALIDQIQDLEGIIQVATIKDVVANLEDALKGGPIEGDLDTWESGFRAAIETIKANCVLD